GALSPGKSISNLFRLTALQHTGTYEVLWQVVGLETDTVYAQGPVQTMGVDDGEAAFIHVVEGDGGQAVAGGHDYSQGDLVVEVRNIHGNPVPRSEEHTSELQSRFDLVCRLLLEKKT